MLLRNEKKFTLRNWDDESDYGDAQEWSYRRWAWEFLRRNVEYQTACNAASGARGADHTAEAAKFGRVDLRPYWLEYQRTDDARSLWLAERAEIVQNVPWSFDDPSNALRKGQVALIFDLTQTAMAGTAALVAMQEHGNRLLRQALKEYCQPHINSGAKPQLFRPAAKPLLEKYLRLYDAIEIFRVPRDAVISVLYSQYWDKKSQTISDGVRQDAHKMISKNLKKARLLVNSEYQTLVPLDVARAEEVRERKVIGERPPRVR